MRGIGHERNELEEAEAAVELEEAKVEAEEAAVEEIESALSRHPSTSSLLEKGRDERLQWSHTNAISPPALTHSLYLAIETEREHRMCVHLSHKSQDTALLALVTPFAQTTQGLATFLIFFSSERGVEGPG